MDVQMVILIRAADTPFKDHDVPVAVCRTSLTPFSYAAFRDRDLVNDLKRFAALHNLVLETTHMTSSLLYLLLAYQVAFKPKGPAAAQSLR
ncbi:hypothetical protein GJ744_006745 [Endocarpon pusillum]|uniref:Uncharacterized protein n=1 Tax=Endocarpon pusillum TaxID=364733 RepID=A0A8H7A769_9EURO|nr:hypothetical protein GJ744_006745 [Endocarpon pusillum]